MYPKLDLPRVYRLWATKFSPDPRLFEDYPEIGGWRDRLGKPTNEFNPGRVIEFAGRACYHSWHNPSGRTTPEYVRNIIQQGHWSVLEHVSVGYLIVTSREVTHELVRHRHFSYSQESTRYVNVDDHGVNVPFYLLSSEEDLKKVEDFLRHAKEMYQWALEKATEHYASIGDSSMRRKLVRQDARRLAIPTGVETRIVVSGNLRAWMEAIPKRTSPLADWAIRRVFLAILRDLTDFAPEVFHGQWRAYVAPDGYEAAEVTWEPVRE